MNMLKNLGAMLATASAAVLSTQMAFAETAAVNNNVLFGNVADPQISIDKGQTKPEKCLIKTVNAIGIPGATTGLTENSTWFSLSKTAKWVFTTQPFDETKHTLSKVEHDKTIRSLAREGREFPEGPKIGIEVWGEYNEEDGVAVFHVSHEGSAFKPPSSKINNGYDAVDGKISLYVDNGEKPSKLTGMVPHFSSGVVMAKDYNSNPNTPLPNWVLLNTGHGQWVDKTIANIHKIFGDCIEGKDTSSVTADPAPMPETYGTSYQGLHLIKQ